VSSPSPISCLNCGYSIAGLDASALCPECAHPIQASAAAHRSFGITIANPAALARLLLQRAILQLAFALVLIPIVLDQVRVFPFKQEIVEIAAYFLGLSLWLCATITSNFVTAGVIARTPQKSFSFLIAMRVAICLFLIASLLMLLLECASDTRTPGSVAIFFAALAGLTQILALLPDTDFHHEIILILPSPLQMSLRVLNGIVFLMFCFAFTATLLSFFSPPVLLVLPLAPALSSLRSFTLAHQIRAAICEP